MSSILRALKKLEEERPPEKGRVFIPDATTSDGAYATDSTPASKKNVIFFGIGLVSLIIAAVALMAALAIGPFADYGVQVGSGPNTQSVDNPTTEGDTKRSQDVGRYPSDTKPSASASPATVSDRRERSESGSRNGSSAPTPSVSQLRKTMTSRQSTNRVSTSPAPTAGKASGAKLSDRTSKWPDVRPAAPPDNDPKPEDRPARRVDGTEFNPPMLASADLKLQAISWAEEPRRRLAVINGEILHIGEQTSGYVIVNIRLNDVIVKQDGTMWRMVFRSK
ncbi:hypothetical protein D3OALGA1CA_4630 [Olavius algarvensis associated proteobacterium Delta 3]|nr:hypothetical protein D3OALGB2SA_4818 [Olavius algarvensis associated proteobacterium Delta 3]CAB5154435.1 hypothetical protein D3OALGA1CA_4630 [Olavius algarvensis associated proteobacterium Delta 3]